MCQIGGCESLNVPLNVVSEILRVTMYLKERAAFASNFAFTHDFILVICNDRVSVLHRLRHVKVYILPISRKYLCMSIFLSAFSVIPISDDHRSYLHPRVTAHRILPIPGVANETIGYHAY